MSESFHEGHEVCGLNPDFTGYRVFAEQRGMMPHPQLHPINPNLSLSVPATKPVQQQTQDLVDLPSIGAAIAGKGEA